MAIDSVKPSTTPAVAPATPAAPAAPVQEAQSVEAPAPEPKAPSEGFDLQKKKIMSVSGRYVAPPPVISDRTDLKDIVAAQRSAAGVNGSSSLVPSSPTPSAAPAAAPAAPTTVQASDKKNVDEAVKKAEKKLENGPLTKGPEAVEAMNLIKALPPEQQSEAISKLSKGGNLGNMIDNVPESQQHELAPLTANAKDPKQKLQLWEASQQGVAAKTIDDKIKTLGTSPADQEMKATLERTKAANKTEIAEEAAFLRAKPGGPDKASVDKMIARKDTELGVEVKHGVNLTNDPKVRANGSKVVWEKDELEALDRSFTATPKQHLTKTPAIHRAEKNGKINAEHFPNGTIHIYDNACSRDAAGQLVRDGTREMSDPETVRKGGAQATFLEWTVQHELGHHVDAFHTPPGFGDKYRDVMGNKTHTDAEAAKLVTPAELAQMKANAALDPPGPATIKGDRGYLYENGKVYSYDATVFPKGWPGSGEYIAQHYNQANLQPQSTATEYLDAPKAKAAAANEKLKQLKAAGAPAADIAAADKAARGADREVVMWKKSYEMVRNDMYGADKATDAAVKRLEAKGASPEQIQAFRDRAYRVSTPEQVAKLEAQGPLAPD